jgi:hypothetical protein
MEQKRVKSAWEIAMERAERLGRLSPEELRKQEENEHRPIGEGLADRYLSGLPPRDVEAQLGRYTGAAAEFVRQGLLARLTEAFQWQELQRTRRALQGIREFFPSARMNDIASRLEQLLGEYELEKTQSAAIGQQQLATEAEGILRERGLGGSALRPNLEATATWHHARMQSEAAYEERLAVLTEELRRSL